MSTDDARQRADTIRTLLRDLSDGRDRVLGLIRDARDSDDASALGYASWTAYVAGEFGDLLPRLTRAERVPIASEMRALGMSTTTIAPVLGVNPETIRRDVAGTSASVEVATGRDGRTRPTRYKKSSPSPEDERRRAAWQPFRALMSTSVTTLIEHVDELLSGHDWHDLDDVHARHGIDSRAVVLERLRALRDAANRLLAAWDDEPSKIRRIK